MQRRRERLSFICGSRYSQQLWFGSDTLRLIRETWQDSRHSKHSLSEMRLCESNFMLVAFCYDIYIQSQLVSQTWDCSSLWRRETIVVSRFSDIYWRSQDCKVVTIHQFHIMIIWYVFCCCNKTETVWFCMYIRVLISDWSWGVDYLTTVTAVI